MKQENHQICDYEGSNYQETFWDTGERDYEDQVEEIALKRLLPADGRLMLEIGAGAGRNTPRYENFSQIVLLDYSLTQVQKAKQKLGESPRYIYVAGDVYNLPFVEGLFDAATMIRVIHHLVDPHKALTNIREVLRSKAIFILEYANKHNLKAMLRYLLGKQKWNPYSAESVELVELNFNFHPRTVKKWLNSADFKLDRTLTVSHFRIGALKKIFPIGLLVWLDQFAQLTGNWWQLTPSVFTRNIAVGETDPPGKDRFFRCPVCKNDLDDPGQSIWVCSHCQTKWAVRDGIYDFRQPIE